jgi:hypothetical protein
MSWLLRISRPFAVTAHDLHLVRLHRLTRVLHLESDVLYQEGPDLVAETVGIKMTLCPVSIATSLPHQGPYTLNVNLAFTLSANTSVMLRSKFARIFIASWGSMRRSLIKSSRVSVSAMPMLKVSQSVHGSKPACRAKAQYLLRR